MRRTSALALAILLVFAGAAPAAAAPGQPVEVGVRLDDAVIAANASGSPPPDRIYCDGFAPDDPICEGSFVLTSNFDIVISFATSYFGVLALRGETTTGSVNVVCDVTYTTSAPTCAYRHLGVFIEGQRFTLRSVAAGDGYWRVRVPG